MLLQLSPCSLAYRLTWCYSCHHPYLHTWTSYSNEILPSAMNNEQNEVQESIQMHSVYLFLTIILHCIMVCLFHHGHNDIMTWPNHNSIMPLKLRGFHWRTGNFSCQWMFVLEGSNRHCRSPSDSTWRWLQKGSTGMFCSQTGGQDIQGKMRNLAETQASIPEEQVSVVA